MSRYTGTTLQAVALQNIAKVAFGDLRGTWLTAHKEQEQTHGETSESSQRSQADSMQSVNQPRTTLLCARPCIEVRKGEEAGTTYLGQARGTKRPYPDSME